MVLDVSNQGFMGELTPVNGELYFVRTSGNPGVPILGRTDGTVKGTQILTQWQKANSISSITALSNVNGTLYFTATDGKHGSQPWIVPEVTHSAPL